MKKKKLLFMGIILLVIILLGCLIYFLLIKKDNKQDSTVTTTTSTTTTKVLSIVNPDSKSRPYAIMINNADVARSLQSGLQDAYIIYEIIVEGGLTRIMAIYKDSNVSLIGPIRSARHYFLDYALESDAIYVHYGWSPYALSDFSKLGIDRIVVDNSKTGWRDKTLTNSSGKKVSSEHTLFTSTDKLSKGIGSKRTERKNDLLLNYSIDELDLSKKEDAISAKNILIKYSGYEKTSYEYDEENKVYKRFVNGKEHTDYVTKKQYTFKNIITYQVVNKTVSGDKKGRQDIDNIGSGTGYYITNGAAVPIKWEKKSRKEQTIYRYLNGEEIIVNDGNTFIQIQPKGLSLTIE